MVDPSFFLRGRKSAKWTKHLGLSPGFETPWLSDRYDKLSTINLKIKFEGRRAYSQLQS